jgi:RHS repeat-associated protein
VYDEVSGSCLEYCLRGPEFTGKERDTESGLDMFGARYYGSGLGRFMTPDWAAKATAVPYAMFGDPQTLNLYGYVRNNPLSHVDADGHCLEDACIAETAAVFALYAYTTSPAGQQVIQNGLNALASTPSLFRNLFKSDSGNKNAPAPTPTNTQNQAQSTPADPNQGQSDKEGAQDKKLTKTEVSNLEKNTGETAEDIKSDTIQSQKAGKFDLYKNSDGDIVVKPKGSSGAGETTGYTTEHLKTPEPEVKQPQN